MAAALAKRIRSTLEHVDDERIDLAGYSEVQANDLMSAAFSEPHPAAAPLRFTFIIGGGKLVRSRYDESLGKWLCAALRKSGYDEDKGAALGSQRAFKQQHDTGQNLIYLHVYPAIAGAATGGGAAAAAAGTPGSASAGGGPLPPALARVVEASDVDFPRLAASRVAPWSHKRRLVGLLTSLAGRLADIEGKLAGRAALTPEEQALYDAPGASSAAITEKATWLQGRAKEQAQAGALTAKERASLLAEVAEKLGALPPPDNAAAGGKAKGAAAARDALLARQEALKVAFAAAAPAVYPVAGLADIRRTRAELARLAKVEAAGATGPGGRMLTPAEALARAHELDARPELEARLAALLDSARGWFETPAELEERIQEQAGGSGCGGGGAQGAGKKATGR